MGFNFDDNGHFIGWSDLFDYSSNEALESSCSLPVPRNSKWIKDLNYLQEALPKKHANLFFKVSKDQFNNQINELKKSPS